MSFDLNDHSEFSLRCEEKRQLFEICKLIALSYEFSIDSVTSDFTKLYLNQDRVSSEILGMKISTFHETLFTPRKMNFPKMLYMKILTRFSGFANQTFYYNLMPDEPENCSFWNASL